MKVNCLDIELAIMGSYKIRSTIIVPNVTEISGLVSFEADVLAVTNSGYAHCYEIKVSRSDLLADFKKKHHARINEVFYNGKTGIELYFGRLKYFSYAVPDSLKDVALEKIPAFAGLYLYKPGNYPDIPKFWQERAPQKLFDKKWTDKELANLGRLAAMRLPSLMGAIKSLKQTLEHYRNETKEENAEVIGNIHENPELLTLL
jgi:hypothetical protein